MFNKIKSLAMKGINSWIALNSLLLYEDMEVEWKILCVMLKFIYLFNKYIWAIFNNLCLVQFITPSILKKIVRLLVVFCMKKCITFFGTEGVFFSL